MRKLNEVQGKWEGGWWQTESSAIHQQIVFFMTIMNRLRFSGRIMVGIRYIVRVKSNFGAIVHIWWYNYHSVGSSIHIYGFVFAYLQISISSISPKSGRVCKVLAHSHHLS